jgi:hypothetical protein
MDKKNLIIKLFKSLRGEKSKIKSCFPVTAIYKIVFEAKATTDILNIIWFCYIRGIW